MDTLASAVLPAHASAAGAPGTSAGAVLPAAMAAAPAGPSAPARGSHALILQAMAAVLVLACLAAYVAFRRLMAGVESGRRQRQQAASAALDLLKQHKREALTGGAQKGRPVGTGGAILADGGSGGAQSAPETPELLYTPKQDRRGSHDLAEVVTLAPQASGSVPEPQASCNAQQDMCSIHMHVWSAPRSM